MSRYVRRVVTGHDETGKAIVVSDGPATNILERPNRPGVALINLWQNFETPTAWDGPDETVEDALILHPPHNGAVFRVLHFEPENPDVLAKLDGKAAFSAMGAANNIIEGARHPFMHRTDSVDFAVVLKGRIMMLLDDTELELREGDTLVQRGNNHAWSNRFDETCIMAFVLIDGKGSVERWNKQS